MARPARPSSATLDRYVLPGERYVVAQRRHWGSITEPLVTGALALVVVGLLVPVLRRTFGLDAWPLWWLLLIPLGRAVWRYLEWRATWFVATDKRLLLTSGLVTRKVAMLPLGKVTDMSYARTPSGRALGYGRFVLESAGQDQAMRTIDWVAHPDTTYRLICDSLFGPGAPVYGFGGRGRPGEDDARGQPAATTGELPVVPADASSGPRTVGDRPVSSGRGDPTDPPAGLFSPRGAAPPPSFPPSGGGRPPGPPRR
jgi:hypothetical protein